MFMKMPCNYTKIETVPELTTSLSWILFVEVTFVLDTRKYMLFMFSLGYKQSYRHSLIAVWHQGSGWKTEYNLLNLESSEDTRKWLLNLYGIRVR